MNPDEYVWHGDKLEICLLGIREEDLGLPNCLDESRVGEVERGLDVGMR